MGCDISVYSERKVGNKYVGNCDNYFEGRCYAIFGFLADARNVSEIKPISQPRGLPDDMSKELKEDISWGGHNTSWLSIKELMDFDYSVEVEDRRYIKDKNDVGIKTTMREFLGEYFFTYLQHLKDSDTDRIVFTFNS